MKRWVLFCFSLFTAFCTQAQVGERLQHRSEVRNNQSTGNRPPDYSNLHDWAAHPRKHDMADSIAPFLQGEQRDTIADVFFLHPTSYWHGRKWNASLDDEKVNDKTDKGSILNQASVFNAHTRIYAPRYRQAHLRTFFRKNNVHAQQALDLAYEDLKTAFEYYLKYENHGRPIIIASHSQGTVHAIRLLKEYFDGKPLYHQFICAYLVGWPVKEHEFKTILPATSAAQNGCFMSWRSYRLEKSDPAARLVKEPVACINPITWASSEELSDVSMHKGMVNQNLQSLSRQAISARVNTELGILWVKLPDSIPKKYKHVKNYHVADYNLFYMDIRANVWERLKVFRIR